MVLSVAMCVRIVCSSLWSAICLLFSCLWPFRPRVPDLSADICLVTGAAQGLGRHLALQLATEWGATLVLWDIDEEKVRAVEREIRGAGGTAHAYVVDCSEREAVYRAAECVRDEVGDVAVLINNAGVGGFRGSFIDGELTDETIVKMFSVNALAHFWTLRAFLPWMMDNDYGYVVNVASFAAYVPGPHVAAYAAAKTSVRSFSDSLRCELSLAGKRGISVTCVYPSFINTGIMSNAELEAIRERNIGLLEPDRVASVILYGMGEKKAEVFLPASTKFVLFLKLVLPQRTFEMLISRIMGDLAELIKKKKE